MKGTISRFTLAVIFACMTVVNALADNSTRTSVDLPAVAGYTLEPGKMYIVQHDMTITATAGNGLNVAPKGSGQAPILYIPADVTLTVKGANASGTTGAGAGIYVPSNAELIITGAGTLIATGGDAANGGAGENGHNGGNGNFNVTSEFQAFTINDDNASQFVSGAGGKGGNGGGGAGAGIGGIGGQGGQGGDGGASVKFNGTSGNNGKDGSAGSAGSAGVTMGKVSIMGTVKVTANGGAAGTVGGAAGTQGFCMRSNLYNASYRLRWCGAGGGGAGGGAGYSAPGIGAGGRGAGGGAGGGSGATGLENTFSTTAHTGDNYVGRASSATGVGGGVVNGNAATDGKPRDTGAPSGTTACSTKAGNGSNSGGAAGAGPTQDSHGSLYVATDATVTYGSGSFGGNTGTEPEDMQITITFKNNEYAATRTEGGDVAKNGTVGTLTLNIGESLPAASLNTYKLAAKAQESPEKFAAVDKYFAGYYTAENGRGTRAYKGIGTTNLDIANNMILAGDLTLYAHFTHVHHVINWDYCYSDGESGGTSTWTNLNHGQYLNQGKLIFYHSENGVNTLIKEVVMTAYNKDMNGATADATDKTFIYKFAPTAGLDNHTRAQGNIYLSVGNTTDDQLNSENNITIHFTDDDLVTFNYYEFIPWTGYTKGSTEGNRAEQWQTIVDTQTHQTVYSFTGAKGNNQYTQKWSVKLTGLKIYPSSIFAKPLYKDTDSEWKVISQLPTRYNGVTCYPSETHFGAGISDADSYVIYTGEYPVWKTYQNDQSETVDWEYRVGLVGYTIDGKIYYMDGTAGDVHSDMISPNTINSTDDNIGTASKSVSTPFVIQYTKPASDIPVLRLMANGGQFTGGAAYYMEVNTSRSGSFALSGHTPTRDGYKLTGWNTTDGVSHYATDATVTPGSNALTLNAEWKEAVDPVINTKKVLYNQNGATIVVTVSDNESTPATGLKVYAYVSDTEVTDVKTITDTNWGSEITVTGTNDYNINVTGKSTAWIYVKAQDAADNKAYQSSPSAIKIDGIAPTYEIYPEGNVCNFNVEITAKDNIQIAKVEYRKSTDDVDTWTDVTSSATGTTTEKTFTVNKLESNTCANDESTHTSVDLSLRITDAANNVTLLENFTHMYYNHVWNTDDPKHAMVLNTSTGKYEEHTYYNCKHGCGHIWDTTVCGDVNTYAHDYTGEGKDDPTTKQHKEQGLMRSETTDYLQGSGTVVVSNNEGIIGIAHDINSAITTGDANERTITLIDDTKVDNASGASLSNPGDGKKVTIDLNGHGLKVGDSTGDITGNANVTILLNDNGGINYTNGSTVTGSPIKYHRDFASGYRSGKWQALYLPFAAGTVEGYEFGTVKHVAIGGKETELAITKGATNLAANTTYFVRSSNGIVDITNTADLLPYNAPTETPILAKEGGTSTYTIKGSLTDTDNAASANKAYWVLTNGGAFTWAKAGSHQRPYHWVIYDKRGGSTTAKALSMVIVEEEATGIYAVNKEMKSSNAVYTLDGRKVNNIETLAPGMYIIGSKKIVIK